MFKKNHLYIFILILFSACASVKPYGIPAQIKTPHAEEMAKFKNKKDIFLQFGVPDKQASVDSIEIYEYKLGELTHSSTRESSHTIGSSQRNSQNNLIFSGIARVATNPYYVPNTMNTSNNIYLSHYVTSSVSNSSSETTLKYAKFWLINNEVMKWETQGIDLGKMVPNPLYNEKNKNEWDQKSRKEAIISNAFIVTIISVLILVSLL